MFQFAQLSAVPMSSVYFTLPEMDYGRKDIHITIEYVRNDNLPDEVQCWAWAQVGENSAMRGLVATYPVPYEADPDELMQSVISGLAVNEEFRSQLPGYINHVESHYGKAEQE